MRDDSNTWGNVRFITLRFSSTYDTPEGHRRLSSSTYTWPSSCRTRSVPVTWHQMPCGGVMPWHCGRSAFADWITSAGTMPSFTIRWSW
jgi:hypothetical protein